MSEDYDNISNQLHDDDSVDNSTIASASYMDEDDAYATGNPYSHQASRKRKRAHEDTLNQEHRFFADQLLDYFMLSASETGYGISTPMIPDHFQINRPIDDQNHTALHWGAAMGDVDMTRKFLERGADPSARNKRGETPLIRAVLFTNNSEKNTMSTLVDQLLPSITLTDNHGATILHHIAMTTNSMAKKKCARYYLDVILHKIEEIYSAQDVMDFIDHQDYSGDTALHIVARYNAKKCVRALQGRGARGDIYNKADETADQIMQKTRSINQDFISSSPAPPLTNAANGHKLVKGSKINGATHYHSQGARSFSQSFGSMAQDKGLQVALAFESEVYEKDNDLAEGQRVQSQIENERQQVRQETLKQLGLDVDSPNDDEDMMNRQEEKHSIMESKSYSEQIQHKDLHQAVRTEEHMLPPSAHQKSNGTLSDDRLEEQVHVALDLSTQQNKRRRLTSAIVTAQGAAGMSAHGERLKQLVSLTCGVAAEEVPALAPDLLDELQQSKMDVGNEVAAMA